MPSGGPLLKNCCRVKYFGTFPIMIKYTLPLYYMPYTQLLPSIYTLNICEPFLGLFIQFMVLSFVQACLCVIYLFEFNLFHWDSSIIIDIVFYHGSLISIICNQLNIQNVLNSVLYIITSEVNPRTPRVGGYHPPLAFFPCNFFDDSNGENRLIVSVTRDGRHILAYVTSS